MQHNYFVYILTNYTKRVLYTGVTNNLRKRIWEHYFSLYGESFTSKYKCYYLIYFERFQYVNHAIKREKEIKGWKREKKLNLIETFNPGLQFLNTDLFEEWPPSKEAF